MIATYFSEREGFEEPRNEEEIGPEFWAGFVALIRARLNDGSFAEVFPSPCFDTPYPMDCDAGALGRLFAAENGAVAWPLDSDNTPETLATLDGVEFFFRHVSKVTDRRPHVSSSLGHLHDHLVRFDRSSGRAEYISDVNRLLRRCRHPYDLHPDGAVRRIGAPVARELLARATFNTGNSALDRLLEVAREKFRDPEPDVRAEAVERLWDAWERLKTLPSPDKKASVKALLDIAVPEPNFRAAVEAEANELTRIGNAFMIRHTETNRTPLVQSEHVDYLFHRLFALIWMILRSRGASGT
jgi:hypothetical protein